MHKHTNYYDLLKTDKVLLNHLTIILWRFVNTPRKYILPAFFLFTHLIFVHILMREERKREIQIKWVN